MPTTPSADAGPDAARVAAIGAGVLGLALSIAAFAVFGLRSGLSVAVGATIAVANLVTMSAIIRALLRPAEAEAEAIAAAEAEKAEAKARGEAREENEEEAEPPVDHAREGKRGGAAWGLFAVLKIVVLFGGIYLLLTKGLVDPIALVVGYGVLPLGIAASSLVNSLSPRARRPARRPPSRTR
jgi:hypothetical protein